MTICINLAATLTPFGSAQNVMIASYFGKSLLFFLKYVSIYFVLGTFLTLVLLDKFILKKYTNEEWAQHCEDDSLSHPKGKGNVPEPIPLSEINPNPKVIKRNSIALGIFIVLLVIIPELYLAGLIGMLIFVFINPMKYKDGKNRPNVSNIFRKVDYKLIYFFICLFILVYLMELNGFILLIERMLENLGVEGVFGLSVIVLLLTSLLSGLIDNAPVTVVFLPIIQLFINNHPNFEIPFIIAMILGINLGGNFLPQGSAADMMTLELSEKYCVYDLNYKVLVKNGGLFALFHVVLGIVYLAFIIYVFPI